MNNTTLNHKGRTLSRRLYGSRLGSWGPKPAPIIDKSTKEEKKEMLAQEHSNNMALLVINKTISYSVYESIHVEAVENVSILMGAITNKYRK